MKKTVLLGIIALLIVGGSIAFLILKKSDASSNTPLQNKQIEIKASQEKDESLCETIKGESYKFGPTDGKITISQSEARAQCHQNIKDGIHPPLYGG